MRSQSRAGFTLIELMVSMALTLLIMAILSQAFMMALETFSGLKGIGDMQQLLRTAIVAIQNDLAADHFDGSRRLNDSNVASPGAKIQAGFFALRQGAALAATAGATYFDEGADQNTVPSYRAVDHVLHFTVKRRGNRQEDFFTAPLTAAPGPRTSNLHIFFGIAPNPNPLPAYNFSPSQLADVTLNTRYSSGSDQGFFASQWAEVCYYLERTGSTEEPNNPASDIGTPTFALKRAQFVMVPDSTKLNDTAASQINNSELPAFDNLACKVGATTLTFFSPLDTAAAPGKRTLDTTLFTTAPTTFATTADPRVNLSHSTLVLPNVISFEIQVMRSTDAAFPDPPTWIGLYDTARFNSAGYANNFGLKAIQITMRVFDTKTRQTRQTTIIQDL